MAKTNWNTPVDHTGDAGFRAWGLELSGRLATAGLVQTADTGQINWTTATRPGSNAYAGYEVWRFNDALQSSAPVFIRLEYGTSNNTGTPALRVTVGTGSNGAGTMTGVVSSQHILHCANILVTNAATTNFNSYACHTAGFFGLAWKMGAGAGAIPLAGFTLQRSTTNAGVPTAEAVQLISCGATNSFTAAATVSTLNFVTSSASLTDGNDLAVIPGRLNSSLVGLDPQIFTTWMAIPKMRANIGTGAHVGTEVPIGAEFDLALVGSTPRHYIGVGSALRCCAYHGGGTVRGAVMLWED